MITDHTFNTFARALADGLRQRAKGLDEESARIVRDFCGEWYSKTEYEQGINLDNSSRFLAVAVRKLRSELEQQGSEF